MTENILQVSVFSCVGKAHPWDALWLEQSEETGWENGEHGQFGNNAC